MHSRSPRLLGAIVLGVLALALSAGLSLGRAGTVHAQSMTPGQMGSGSGTCADDDSWCNYCMTNPTVDSCEMYPPVMVTASSTGTGTSSTPPVMAEMPATSTMSTTTAGESNLLPLSTTTTAPVGVTWQFCPNATTGAIWEATNPEAGNLIC